MQRIIILLLRFIHKIKMKTSILEDIVFYLSETLNIMIVRKKILKLKIVIIIIINVLHFKPTVEVKNSVSDGISISNRFFIMTILYSIFRNCNLRRSLNVKKIIDIRLAERQSI